MKARERWREAEIWLSISWAESRTPPSALVGWTNGGVHAPETWLTKNQSRFGTHHSCMHWLSLTVESSSVSHNVQLLIAASAIAQSRQSLASNYGTWPALLTRILHSSACRSHVKPNNLSSPFCSFFRSVLFALFCQGNDFWAWFTSRSAQTGILGPTSKRQKTRGDSKGDTLKLTELGDQGLEPTWDLRALSSWRWM